MDKLRAVLNGRDGNTDSTPNIIQTVNEASTLSWTTRVRGFAVCMGIGILCSVLVCRLCSERCYAIEAGFSPLVTALTERSLFRKGVCCLFIPKIGIILFIILYTFGNICSLASTMFLMGPVKQLKRMFDKTRAFATVVMLWIFKELLHASFMHVCLVLTLCAAFWWKIFVLSLLFVILQVIAFAWYGLSYIPFAREAVLKFFSTMCKMCIKCSKPDFS